MLYDENGEFSDVYKVTQKYYAEAGVRATPLYLADGVDWCYSTKKLNSSSDLIGLPYRTSGVTSEILTEMGAATVWLPWEELYTALQMGTVEACEWGSPDLMFGMGLQEVCKWWYLPGIWTGYTETRVTNLDAWNALPDDLKVMVEDASKATWLLTQATSTKRDATALQKAQAAGVTIGYWTENDLALFKSAWKAVMDNIGSSGEPYTAELYELIKEYRMSLGEWPE
jgi:TRAP-type mannitol/chloroaromatic compound transport system substrate-binding protein